MSNAFTLHPRLAADTIALGDWPLCRLLLMNDARFPWVILVPARPDLREIHDLPPAERATLIEEIARASALMQQAFKADKMNVAALGNQVPQLHIHIIARFAVRSRLAQSGLGSGPAAADERGGADRADPPAATAARPVRWKEARLPSPFAEWFAARGWQPHAHQLELLDLDRAGRSALLVAPTGGGKTLAGFLPSLVELAASPAAGLHTLYVSPLKALAVDIHRNLTEPLAEMGLPITVETRTGDTPAAKRQRQRKTPPQMLLTTPESLALLISYTDADKIFAGLSRVVIDELHALAGNKRGDLLGLGLARLRALAPGCRIVGLSATVADEQALADWLVAEPGTAAIVRGRAGSAAQIDILETREYLPWSGHMAIHAIAEIYEQIKGARTTLVFVNTRAQAELIFQALWRINDDNLPIALHHGSLAPEQRRKVEAAMARGSLRAVVATSSLDLGVDWAAVDLVIQVGAPKGASRLIQRIGRANHRLDEPSRALLVPANRFEVLECRAALEAVRENTLDGEAPRPGGLDVLAQHLLGMACSAPFEAEAMYREVASAAPYRGLPRKDFDAVLDFVATGGYALAAYERWHRLKQNEDGRWGPSDAGVSRRYRMNVGVIVQEPMLKVRFRRGRALGEIEENFIQGLKIGDTFMFAGQLLRFEGLREMTAEVTRGSGDAPKVPGLSRRPAAAHHPSGRSRAGAAGRARPLADPPRRRQQMARDPAPALAAARSRGPAGGELSPRRQAIPGRLLLRGPQRPSDPGHAADPAHGAHGAAAPGLRGDGLRARGLEPEAGPGYGPLVRPGSSGRRSRGLDG